MSRFRELLATTDLTTSARLLYAVLDEYSNGGETQISVRTISELIKCAPMTVRKATKELEEAGFIETETSLPKKGEETATKIYRLILV